MPWSKRDGSQVSECDDDQTAVVKDENGEVEGCHDTEEEANAQIAALEEAEDEMSNGPIVIVSDTSEKRQSPSGKAEKLRSNREDGVEMTFDSEITALEAADSIARINEVANTELEEDDVHVFREFAAHDANPRDTMRRPLSFGKTALNKLAEDYRSGRMFNIHHDGTRQVGHTFDAQVERQSVNGIDANWLAVDWYAPKGISEQRKQDLHDIRTGVIRHTSIEFSGGKWDLQEMDAEGESLSFYHITDNPSGGQDRLEAEGISRVRLGAVRGAQSA